MHVGVGIFTKAAPADKASMHTKWRSYAFAHVILQRNAVNLCSSCVPAGSGNRYLYYGLHRVINHDAIS